MDSFEKMIIDEFLAANWSAFERHCEQHGADADEISERLNDD